MEKIYLPPIYLVPLDVHSGNVARKLKLLTRKQNDAKSSFGGLPT
jgi:hypothetical protein